MIAFLTILSVVVKVVESVVVLAVIFIGADLIISLCKNPRILRNRKAAKQKEAVQEMLRKEGYRRRKEETANKGFFEESFIPGFNSDGELRYRGVNRVPTEETLTYHREMDELINVSNNKNTRNCK